MTTAPVHPRTGPGRRIESTSGAFPARTFPRSHAPSSVSASIATGLLERTEIHMRFVSFMHRDRASWGRVAGDRIVDLGALPDAPSSLKAALAAGALDGRTDA